MSYCLYCGRFLRLKQENPPVPPGPVKTLFLKAYRGEAIASGGEEAIPRYHKGKYCGALPVYQRRHLYLDDNIPAPIAGHLTAFAAV